MPDVSAAGVVFLAPSNCVLFLRRSQKARDHVGEWCFPCGMIEPDETPLGAAKREAQEETGVGVPGTVRLLSKLNNDDVECYTFCARVPFPFKANIDDESDAWCWAPASNPPQPLHPGCAIPLKAVLADETQTARMVADEELPSPTHFENVWLFAVRITGTGMSYRRALDEYVWRDPSIYLNDGFIARCNGLPVIIDHPENSMLDGEEFAKRIAGTIVYAYIKGDDVWGIARIYDEAAAKLMQQRQLSTSPAVVFRDPSENENVNFDGGIRLLIEGKPALLDHLAICENGVWDKNGDASGVRLDSDAGKTDMRFNKIDALLEKAREIRMKSILAV